MHLGSRPTPCLGRASPVFLKSHDLPPPFPGSQVTDETIQAWLDGKLSDDVSEVPGIGEDTKKLLMNPVSTRLGGPGSAPSRGMRTSASNASTIATVAVPKVTSGVVRVPPAATGSRASRTVSGMPKRWHNVSTVSSGEAAMRFAPADAIILVRVGNRPDNDKAKQA